MTEPGPCINFTERVYSYNRACNSGTDVSVVFSRVSMLGMLQFVGEARHLKFPWIHDGKPEEVVFKVVATIPMSDYNPVSSTKDFRSMSKN